MTLTSNIVLRPNGFSQPDFDVIHKDPDGRELDVGRIYRDITGTVGGAAPWFWTVEHHQRKGRAEPHQGRCNSLDEAKAAWRKCWDSADTPIIGRHHCSGTNRQANTWDSRFSVMASPQRTAAASAQEPPTEAA